MENSEKYVGSGWANDYGINIQIKVEELKDLPIDSYGNVKLWVGKRKEVDNKSKASHYVKFSPPKPKEDLPF